MKTLDASEFWQAVKDNITNAGFTQAEVCRRCGFNEGSFKNRISKKGFPTIDEVFLMAELLDVSIDELTGRNVPEVPKDVLNYAYELNALPPAFQNIVKATIESCKSQLSIQMQAESISDVG